MSKISIDLSKMDNDEKIELALIKELQEAERNLGNALLIISMTPEKTISRLSQKALKCRHKLQILKAQVHDVLENSLQFRSAVRQALEKEFLKSQAAA